MIASCSDLVEDGCAFYDILQAELLADGYINITGSVFLKFKRGQAYTKTFVL